MATKSKISGPPVVLGIDPGLFGAFVLTDGTTLEYRPMPTELQGKDRVLVFREVHSMLVEMYARRGPFTIYLERAVSFGMSGKGAFNYGRGFEAIVIAIGLVGIPYALIEPGKWTKEMHEGTPADLKPKVRSLLAVKRLYPHLVESLPKKPKGGLHDGPIDALLIAGYGLRRLNGARPAQEVPARKPKEADDFY